MITTEIQKLIDESVLCWLATVDEAEQPNVSPKEIFCSFENQFLLIANIASPQSAKNIVRNNKVAVSFVNILSQRGFQLKGNAELIDKNTKDYSVLVPKLEKMTLGKYPISNIFKINILSVKKIIAPSYMFYPEITEEEKIESAKDQYNLH